jgi:hypothetical protein
VAFISASAVFPSAVWHVNIKAHQVVILPAALHAYGTRLWQIFVVGNWADIQTHSCNQCHPPFKFQQSSCSRLENNSSLQCIINPQNDKQFLRVKVPSDSMGQDSLELLIFVPMIGIFLAFMKPEGSSPCSKNLPDVVQSGLPAPNVVLRC